MVAEGRGHREKDPDSGGTRRAGVPRLPLTRGAPLRGTHPLEKPPACTSILGGMRRLSLCKCDLFTKLAILANDTVKVKRWKAVERVGRTSLAGVPSGPGRPRPALCFQNVN